MLGIEGAEGCSKFFFAVRFLRVRHGDVIRHSCAREYHVPSTRYFSRVGLFRRGLIIQLCSDNSSPQMLPVPGSTAFSRKKKVQALGALSVFRVHVLRILRVLAVFRGSLLWILFALRIFRGSVLRVLHVLAVSEYNRSVKCTWTICAPCRSCPSFCKKQSETVA